MIKLFVLLSCIVIEVMASYKVEVVPSPLSVLGEGPHWDIETQSLYYIDIYGNKASINRYDYAENKTYGATVDGEPVIGFIIPVEGSKNEFAIGIGRRVGIISWDGKSPKAKLVRIALEVEKGERYKTNRFNDAKADPTGRFYGGTMRLEECGDIFEAAEGSFYKYAKDEELSMLKTNIGVSNGLAWNAEKGKFYYIDTCTSDVKEFDYDSKTGNISNEKVLIDFRVNGERPSFGPDGMTIDAEGNLYVCTWGGSKIMKIDPNTGKIVLEIKFPSEQITSAAFGGPNLDILYVTSAATERSGPQPPPAGSLFKVTGLGVKGLPMKKVRL